MNAVVPTPPTIRFNYRIRVSSAMEQKLVSEWDNARFVWNRCVEESINAHKASTLEQKVTCGPAELDKKLTGWRAEHDWLGLGSSVAQQQTIREFGKARAKALADIRARLPFKQRRGLPRFKARARALPTLQYSKRGFSLKEGENGRLRLHLAGGIVVRPVWSRELPSAPSSVRIFRDAVGYWWASFVVKTEAQPLPANGRVIGIDWGVKEIATTTDDDFDFPHPQRRKSAQAKLTHYQRQMSRRKPKKGQPASNSYKKAKRHVAKVHRQVARQRQDDARKWAKAVVVNHDQIAVEDFKPKFLAKSTMASKAADAAIGTTKRELIAMSNKHCRDLRLVNPSYTTMDCSECGARAKHRLLLSERTYACSACGLVTPRDKNSAAVMVVRAGFNPASAESVRLEPPLESQAA